MKSQKAAAINEDFLLVDPRKHESLDFTHHDYPTHVQWKDRSSPVQLTETGTHFIFCTADSVTIKNGRKAYILDKDCYASITGAAVVEGTGTALISSRVGYQGMNSMGGPIEELGRLKYINGCSSTVLIAPLKKGDPCYNFLHIPPGARQAVHTHPTLRVCYVVEGKCFVTAGQFICIPAHVEHSFYTGEESMRIVVYHPDSEVGPSDEEHPMLNRTLVAGVPAHLLLKEEYQARQ
jgi:hypothetical protein